MNRNALVRRVALVVLIVCSISASVLSFVWGQSIWGVFIASCFALTIGFEAYAYLTDKETISTKYKRFRNEHPVQSAVVLILLIISFLSLGVHLWPR